MYRIDNWTNEGSGLIFNISTYRPLSGSSYIKLPTELARSEKGTISIKIQDQKYFLWCHFKHIDPVKIHSERITQKVKKPANPSRHATSEVTL